MEGRLTTAETKLATIAEGANKITVDSSLSSTSTNPVQNKVINTALTAKANSSSLSNYLPLSGGDITGTLGVKTQLNTDVVRSFNSIYSNDGKVRTASINITPIKFDEVEPLIKLNSKMDSSNGDTVKTQTLTVNGNTVLSNISSSSIADYPIKAYTSGNWYIMQFANGLTIQTRSFNIKDNTAQFKVGDTYKRFLNLAFPIPLNRLYSITANDYCNYAKESYGSIDLTYFRNTTTSGCTVCCDAQSLDINIGILVIGVV